MLYYVIFLQEWAGGVLLDKRKSFLEYCSETVKDLANIDSFQIVIMAHYIGRNITLVYATGEQWSTDPNMKVDIVLGYKGNNEFIPTDVGTYTSNHN